MQISLETFYSSLIIYFETQLLTRAHFCRYLNYWKEVFFPKKRHSFSRKDNCERLFSLFQMLRNILWTGIRLCQLELKHVDSFFQSLRVDKKTILNCLNLATILSFRSPRELLKYFKDGNYFTIAMSYFTLKPIAKHLIVCFWPKLSKNWEIHGKILKFSPNSCHISNMSIAKICLLFQSLKYIQRNPIFIVGWMNNSGIKMIY